MGARTTIKETEESDAKKTSAEASIFSTILADIEQNPTILQKQKNLSAGFSIFTAILSDIDEENPTTLQKKNEKLKKTRRRGSVKIPFDFTRTVSQTLTHSYLVDILGQELKTLKSEMDTKGRECNCVQDVKVEEQVNKAKGGGGIDEFIEKMLGKIEKDGSYLDRIKDEYVFGDLLEDLLRNKLREKAEKEEKEISSWITNGDPDLDQIGVAEEKKEEKRDTKKKKSPVKVTLERSEQEPTVTKRDYFEYKIRLHLIEKLREGNENLMKRRAKAVRFGVEFSFLVAEYMFLIPIELLASGIEGYWICLKRFGVNDEDDKGASVIIGKLEEVFEIVIRKNKEHNNVDLPDESIKFDNYITLCVDAIQILGKIVWDLRSNQCERLNLSDDLDSLFEDCQKVLMKIELKLAEMKQRIYRSFSKSERFDNLLGRKRMKRVNADNRFGRSVIESYLVETWKSLFQAEALLHAQE